MEKVIVNLFIHMTIDANYSQNAKAPKATNQKVMGILSKQKGVRDPEKAKRRNKKGASACALETKARKKSHHVEILSAERDQNTCFKNAVHKSYNLAPFFSSVGEPFAVIGGEIVPRLERR